MKYIWARAEAQRSQLLCIFLCFLCFFVANSCNALITFSSQELIDTDLSLKPDFIWIRPTVSIRIERPPGAPLVIVRNSNRWQERKQKLGCSAGYRVQLRKQQHKPLLPFIFLTNDGSLTNKMEELHSEIYYNRFVWACYLLIITESWLHPQISDASPPGLQQRLW